MSNEEQKSFEEVKTRLDEIVEMVSDDDILLDNVLDLYEEAIKLGMQVSARLEDNISAEQVEAEVSEREPDEAVVPEQEGKAGSDREEGGYE